LNFNVLDVGLVAVVMAVTSSIRKQLWVPERFLPLVPIAVAIVLSAPAIVFARGRVPGFWVLLSGALVEGLKIAFAAMAAYKVTRTTVLGKGLTLIGQKGGG